MTFRILALGDSVVWGQGLKEQNKFVFLTAKEISKKINEPVQVTMLAHSGAEIGKKKNKASWVPYCVSQKYPYGEIPRDRPNLYTQLKISQLDENFTGYLEPKKYDTDIAKKYRAKLKTQLNFYKTDPPDLIILDGGANDIGLFQIMSPFDLTKIKEITIKKLLLDIARILGTSPVIDSLTDRELQKLAKKYRKYIFLKSDLEKKTKKYCYTDMLDLLKKTRNAYPHSKILVTGYYPVFTKGTLKKATVKAIAALILYVLLPFPVNRKLRAVLLGLFLLFSRNFFITRSLEFADYSNKYLKKAVYDLNMKKGSPEVFFASPKFNDENGMFAKSSYVWPLTFSKPASTDLSMIRSIDDVRDVRLKAVNKFFSHINKEPGIGDREAGIAHPNRQGAKAFCRAIMTELNASGVLKITKKSRKKPIRKVSKVKKRK